jgi:hypothetical protein
MSQNPATGTNQPFEAKAKAEGWVCTRCGKTITAEDRAAFAESKRCKRCHREIDPDSGSIPEL